MKKRILLVAALMAGFGAVKAQEGFQLGLSSGFAFHATNEAIGTSETDDSESVVYGTFGQGIPVNLEMAYFFNENVGIELDATYLLGTSVLNEEVKMTGMSSELTSKTQQFRLSPMLVLKTNGLYTKAGLVVPLSGKTVATYESTAGANKTEIEQELKGKFSLGFNAAIGYEYSLADNMSLFGEVMYTGLTIKRNTAQFTKYTVNGTDVLDTPSGPSSDKVQYEDEVSKTNTDPNVKLGDGAKRNYSTLGINIGVRMSF